MKLLDNLQLSVHRIFEIYKTQGKKYYPFSMTFTIAVSLISSVISIIIYLAYSSSLSAHPESLKGLFSGYTEDPAFASRIADLSTAMIVISMSLYAIFLHKNEQSGSEKPSFKRFNQLIPSTTWGLYAVYLLALTIYTLLFDFIFSKDNSGSGNALENLLGIMGSESGFSFASWLLSLVGLINSFIPFILSFFLVKKYLDQYPFKINRVPLKISFWTVMLIVFVVRTISTETTNYLSYYVLSPIRFCFTDAAFPSALTLIANIFIIAFFCLGMAASFLFPFLEKEQEMEQTTFEELRD